MKLISLRLPEEQAERIITAAGKANISVNKYISQILLRFFEEYPDALNTEPTALEEASQEPKKTHRNSSKKDKIHKKKHKKNKKKSKKKK